MKKLFRFTRTLQYEVEANSVEEAVEKILVSYRPKDFLEGKITKDSIDFDGSEDIVEDEDDDS